MNETLTQPEQISEDLTLTEVVTSLAEMAAVTLIESRIPPAYQHRAKAVTKLLLPILTEQLFALGDRSVKRFYSQKAMSDAAAKYHP